MVTKLGVKFRILLPILDYWDVLYLTGSSECLQSLDDFFTVEISHWL